MIGQLSIPVFAQGVNIDDLGVYTLTGPPDVHGTSGGMLGVFATPSPYLQVAVGAGPERYVRGNATLVYEIAVLSPVGMNCSFPHFGISGPDCSVAIHVDAFGRVEANGGTILVGDPPPFFIVQANWAFQNAQGFDIFSDGVTVHEGHNYFSNEQQEISVTANRVYRVRMSVNAEAKASTLPAGATALVDPVFSFAPGADPGYSFQFSAGIGNSRANPVPEPGSLGLLGAGVVAIRVWRRRSVVGP